MTRRTSVAERLERFLVPGRRDEDCWLWQGRRGTRGYGMIKVDGKAVRAHRVAYALKHGPIPPGFVLDHLCRNPPCVNPAHLEAVTQRENLLRGSTVNARHAAKTQCPKGHPYDTSNTYRDRQGKRHCRACGKSRRPAPAASTENGA